MFLLNLLTCVLSGSVSESPRAAETLEVSPVQRGSVVIHDESPDGVLHAVGRDWKAHFGRDGASFVPFLGSDAPRNEVVRIALVGARVGGVELEVRGDVAATRAEDTLRYARGSVEERFEARVEGLEHVLVFHELPARGELIVRCAVETDLAAHQVGDAIEFTNERGGVRYPSAIAFDAAGRRCTLPSVWDGQCIVLTVPAEVVRDAVLPLTIDPLVHVFGVATTPAFELAPDAALGLGSGGQYRLEVWETAWSQADHDVTARVTKLSNGTETLHAIDASAEYWSRPKAAWIWGNKLASEFQIVAASGLPGSLAREIRGRRLVLTFNGQTLGSPATLATGGGGDHHSPDVGGDPYIEGSGSGSHFLAVWETDYANGDSNIDAATIVGGQAFALPPLSGDPLFDDENPRVSKADGAFLWCVVWERRLSPTNGDIWACTVEWDFAPVTAPVAISSAPEDESRPSVSSAGAAGFVIAYQRDVGGQQDVMAQVYTGMVIHAPVNFTVLEGGTHAPLEQILPVVDGDGLGYVLACKEADPVVPGLFRTRITNFRASVTGVFTLQEVHVPVGGPTTNRSRANVCAENAAVLSNVARFEIVWDEVAASASSDVHAAIYEPGTPPGAVVVGCLGDGSDTACPCGNNGGAPAGCPSSFHATGAELRWTGLARVSADTFVARATRLPPNGVALLAQGTVSLAPANLYGDGILCLGGGQTRIAQRTVDANGELAYPAILADPKISVAGSVPAAGGSRVYQLVYRNLASFCTPATWNTTNSLVVSWSP